MDLADALIFIATLELLASPEHHNALEVVRSALSAYPNLKYTNVDNILALLVLCPPASTDINDMAAEAQLLVLKSTHHGHALQDQVDLEETSYKLEQMCNSNVLHTPDAIISVAESLLVECKLSKTSFSGDVLFDFVVEKTTSLSSYFNDITQFTPLFDLCRGKPEFEKWYGQTIKPFAYYWLHYDTDHDSVTFAKFSKIDSFSGKFSIFIQPLELGQVSVPQWMHSVVLPLVASYEDFSLLNSWLFSDEILNKLPSSAQFRVWNDVISSITTYSDSQTSFSYDQYGSVAQHYLAACYYCALYQSDSISSVEMVRIYDAMSETLGTLLASSGKGNVSSFEFQAPEHPGSFNAFMKNPQMVPLFNSPDAIATFRETIKTCQRLYALNKLTISKYLELKHSNVDYAAKEKEVTRILSGLNESNYTQLLSSARLFTSTFIGENDKSHINKLVVERFLFFDLFDIVKEFYSNNEFGLDVNVFYHLVDKKFWFCFNQATNLNDRIGNLHRACLTAQLFDLFSSNTELEEENRHAIIKIKHLLKAIANMKNFKIVVQKSKPFTPFQLINDFGVVSSQGSDDVKYTPLNLVTIILEQNPKSYLAFEKLYRILIDLLIFLEDDESSLSNTYFLKLQAACIESSLIDGNFEFAYRHLKELFDHCKDKGSSQELNDTWLTFYQVGKYVSPEWFGEDIPQNKIGILMKQREILGSTLKLERIESSVDFSKVILQQWVHINQQIEEWWNFQPKQDFKNGISARERVENLTSEFIAEATNTTSQAGDKLSSLFVSGLGWAIGANPEQ